MMIDTMEKIGERVGVLTLITVVAYFGYKFGRKIKKNQTACKEEI